MVFLLLLTYGFLNKTMCASSGGYRDLVSFLVSIFWSCPVKVKCIARF